MSKHMSDLPYEHDWVVDAGFGPVQWTQEQWRDHVENAHGEVIARVVGVAVGGEWRMDPSYGEGTSALPPFSQGGYMATIDSID